RAWEPLHELGSEKLLPLVTWCTVPPCAALLAAVAVHLGKGTGFHFLGGGWLVAGPVGAAWAIDPAPQLRDQTRRPSGLGRQRVGRAGRWADHPGTEGRILFEERPADGPDAGWTALLAERTGRQFVGGLAPRWGVEHLFARLADGKLAGRPIGEWS